MSDKYGIIEIKELVIAISDAAAVYEGVMENGKVDVLDLPRMPGALKVAREFTGVDYARLALEVKDLDSVEAAELAGLFRSKFNISNDSIEATIEMGVDVLAQLAAAFQDIKDAIQRIRGTKAA